MNVNIVNEAIKEFYSNPEYKQIMLFVDVDVFISKDYVNEIAVYYDTLKVTDKDSMIIYYDISNIKIIKLSKEEE